MWTPLSVSRWVFLLTLAVVMFFSVTPVDCSPPPVALPCYKGVITRKVHEIKECFEQKPWEDCNYHTFVIINNNGTEWYVSPKTRWLKDLIKKGKLQCQPILELR